MNPAIHQPRWYQAIGAVDGPTADKAASQPGMIVMSQLARARLGALHMQCLPDQWRVTTTGKDDEDAALELATKVFDALDHTPVAAFGINYTLRKQLQNATRQSLASHLSQTPFSSRVVDGPPELEKLTLTHALEPLPPVDGCTASRIFKATVTFLPSPDRTLEVSVNVHHDIDPTEAAKFDLSKMLRSSVSIRPEATGYIDATFDRLDTV